MQSTARLRRMGHSWLSRNQLEETSAVTLLSETLKEEQPTDDKLSVPAHEKVAAEALGKQSV